MQIRIGNDGTEIEGYVNAVGRESRVMRDKDGYFTETIQPGAFARALQRDGTRKMLLNRDAGRVLASEGEGLELREDAVGLFARATVDDEEVVEKARRRELRGWSFGFVPIKERFDERDGMRHRTVEDMRLFEVSVIDQRKMPAYAATSVLTRDMDGDEPPVEYRVMDMQDVEVEERDSGPEPPDLDGYRERIRALEKQSGA